ncbi:RNA polymerase sigma factor [Niastella vici]|nr:RNA polymerase sigma-70 factor [Niastella vici]
MALFLRIAQSDEAAFRQLFERHKVRFYATALKLTRSPVLAEEIVQEIFLTIWLKRSLLPDIEKPESYLITMVYNSVSKYFRKLAIEKKMREEIAGSPAENNQEVENWLDAKESQQLILAAINKLPTQQQLIYKLSRESGLSREEIAGQLGISPNTVRNHLQEAMKNIRLYLQQATGLSAILFIINS